MEVPSRTGANMRFREFKSVNETSWFSKLNPFSTDIDVDTDKKPDAQTITDFVIAVPRGRRGPEVADVQKALVALGYSLPKHGVDGLRGSETSNAVKQFQQDNNLQADGDPGPETVAKLNAILKSKPEIRKKLTKSTQSDVKGKFIGAGEPQDVGDIIDINDPVIQSGRAGAEKYLGRPMSDQEWTALIKVTAAEESDPTAMSWVMAAILNRVNRGSWGDNVVSVVSAPYQFEPVTGATGKESRLASLPIPSGRKLLAILNGATTTLPSVPHKIINFTSNVDAAYKGRSGIRYKHELLAKGGEVIGQSIFSA